MSKSVLKAPYPYFGGKRRVAGEVWTRLGDVDNFIEPFAGSAAVLLSRPHAPRIETINDADCMVANFWRATQQAPEAVAEFADGPVNEADLHARHRWLVLSDAAKEFRKRMRSEPDYFDPKIAGWWCWGLCCWIGGGWCTDQGGTVDGGRKQEIPTPLRKGVHNSERKPRIDVPGTLGHGVHSGPVSGELPQKRPSVGRADSGTPESLPGVHGNHPTGERPEEWEQVPHMSDAGRGNAAAGELHQKRPRAHRAAGSSDSPCNLPGVLGNALPDGSRPQLADAFDIGRGVNSKGELGTCEARRAWLVDWFGKLRDRLRLVRVCCGDWLRVCSSDSVTVRLGLTGIFFDPPYGFAAGRDMNLYAVDCGNVAGAVRAYCLERGGDKRYRICLAGYAGEGHEELEQSGWSVVEWAAQGGYGNRSAKGKANAKKERLWFSPHCLRPGEATGLFDAVKV